METKKGHAEKSVQVLRNKAFTKQYEFTSIEQAQLHLDDTLRGLNEQTDIQSEQLQLKPLQVSYDYSKTTK